MCKFHKDVAKDIATDTKTGAFDAGKYAVALTAMAHFRIEQYMPSMFGCDGFVPAEMATAEAQKAIADSGLRSCPHAMARYRDTHIEALRAAMADTASVFSLTQKDLNIAPGEITKDGYKATCCAQPDPTVNGPFMDYAVVYLFDGYDDAQKTYVSGTLSLMEDAPQPQYEAIRMATAHFVAHPGVMETLKQMFEDSLVKIFKAAPADLEQGRGFKQTKGCVMCHDDERREAGGPKPPTQG